MISGRSIGPRYTAFIGIALSLRNARVLPLREQDRRQPFAPVDRRFVGRSPGFEQLHELLARAIVVPLAIAPHDLEQMVERLLALSLRVERDREIEARLMVERSGGDLLFQLGTRPDG